MQNRAPSCPRIDDRQLEYLLISARLRGNLVRKEENIRESFRTLQRAQEFQFCFVGSGANLQLDLHVALHHFRRNTEEPDAGGLDVLKVREHLSPEKTALVNNRIQIRGALAELRV